MGDIGAEVTLQITFYFTREVANSSTVPKRQIRVMMLSLGRSADRTDKASCLDKSDRDKVALFSQRGRSPSVHFLCEEPINDLHNDHNKMQRKPSSHFLIDTKDLRQQPQL